MGFLLFICLLVWFLPSFFAAFSGSDCFTHVRYVHPQEDQSEVFYCGENTKLTVANDIVEKGEGIPPDGYYYQKECVAVCDSNFARRGYDYEAEGYEGVIALFTERYVKNSIQAYSIYAIEYDRENQIAYGFFNLYSRTVGCLSGGGRSNTSKSVLGVYFSYSAKTKTLNILQQIDKGCMVACGMEGCVYVQKQKFYLHPIGRDAQFLCKDIAYNTDGSVSVTFSKNSFLLVMGCEKLIFQKACGICVLGSYNGEVYFNEKK